MNSVLIVDDKWDPQKRFYTESPDFKGYQLHGFSSEYDAVAYLDTLDVQAFPSLIVVDALSGEYPFVDTDSGIKTAGILAAHYVDKGKKDATFLFKSADPKHADLSVRQFRRSYPDYISGTVSFSRMGGIDLAGHYYRIDSNGYIPIPVPDQVKTLLADIARTHPMNVYGTFRDKIAPLHDAWDHLNEVKVDDGKGIAFLFGAGSAKTGPATFSLKSLADLSGEEKHIFICDDIPADVFRYADKLSAIVMTGQSHFPGHMRLLLKPYDISLLIGATSSLPDLKPSQPVTVDPQQRCFYDRKLNIVSIDASMPRIVSMIEEMEIFAKNEVRRTSAAMPRFSVNVSSDQDRNDYVRQMFTGLTRTEHFVSPFVAPDQWSVMKNFLIGEGAKLRDVFAKAGEKYEGLPDVHAKKNQYDRKFLVLPGSIPRLVSGYEREDVIRLLDIPAEEFMAGEDLARFEKLYGRGTRGVQLAKQIPDLYVRQLGMLKGFGRFHNEGIPSILIPAVKEPDDIDFVKECAEKALSSSGRLLSYVYWGAMIETPEACRNIEAIAAKVSFISIGSNDLIAAFDGLSRNNPDDARRLGDLTPAMIDVIKDVVDRARKVNPNIEVSLCGEVAANPETLVALRKADLWIDTFSVPATFKDARLLPLLYRDQVLEEFCGPKSEMDENFYMGPRAG